MDSNLILNYKFGSVGNNLISSFDLSEVEIYDDLVFGVNSIKNKIIDSKTTFDLQIQTWTSDGSSYSMATHISGDDTSRGNIPDNYKFCSTFKLPQGHSKLRIKHNGRNKDITFCWITGLSDKLTYTLTFECCKSNPSISGGLIIRNLKLEVGNSPTGYINYYDDNQVCDDSGNHNIGINYNKTIYSSESPIGYVSILYDGSSYTKLPEISLPNSFSVSCWVKWNSFNTWSRIFDFANAENGGDYCVGLAMADPYGTLRFFGRCGSGAELPDASVTTVELNKWYHLCLVVNNTNAKVFVNGELAKETTINSTLANNYTINYLSKSTFNADTQTHDGFISDFRVYSKALSVNEVLKIYNPQLIINQDGSLDCGEIIETSYDSALFQRGAQTKCQNLLEIQNLYTELDYIESDGSQYINTGVPTKSGLKTNITLKIDEFNPVLNNWNNIFGNHYDGNAVYSIWGYKVDNSLSGYSHNASGSTLQGFTLGQKSTVSLTSTCSTSASTLYLFDINNAGAYKGYRCPMKLYACKMWDGEMLIRDFVPVLRNIDKVAGLYDKVNCEFYASETKYGFIPGPELEENLSEFVQKYKLYNGYKNLSYLKTSGTNFIDTKITPSNYIKLRIEADVVPQTNSDSSVNYLFGVINMASKKYLSCGFYKNSSNATVCRVDCRNWEIDTTINSNTKNINKVVIKTSNTGSSVTIDGVYYGQTTGTIYQDRTTVLPDSNLYLGCINSNSGEYQSNDIKVRELKIWGDEELVRDFIPVIRNDNKRGFFDLITHKFYSGNFVEDKVPAELGSHFTSLLVESISEL